MRFRKLAVAAVIVIVAGVAAAVYFNRMVPLSLVAKGSVPVFATVDDSMASPAAKTVAVLQPQQSVPVLQCVDVKHYQVYKVRLPDGSAGYVNVGEYAVLGKDGKRSSC